MKKYMMALGLFVMLLCTLLPISVSATSEPTIRLPTDFLKLAAPHGPVNWFDMSLSDVENGYDIQNGVYPGWCINSSITMQNAVFNVKLTSSYDPNLQDGYSNINWHKINYIINNKGNYNKSVIQNTIWFYCGGQNISNYTGMQALIKATDTYGGEFNPQPGQTLAIPIYGYGPTVFQPSFLELTIPTHQGINGLVWSDFNGNGIQDANEPGITNIGVGLYYSANNSLVVPTTTTNLSGYYAFLNILPGNYNVLVTIPSQYQFSPKNAGSDDTIDSDVNTAGRTDSFTVTASNSTFRLDAGLAPASSSGGGGTTHHNKNSRPIANTFAGVPYKGVIREEITFNGSWSSDADGRIIGYLWNFGDGTNGSGVIKTHTYSTPGYYTVTLTVTDNEFATGTNQTTANISSGNNPPFPPSITGPLFGHTNTSYSYTVLSTDPDQDSLTYNLNWGDNENTTSALTPSGTSAIESHSWTTAGIYTVVVKSSDNSTDSPLQTLTVLINVHYVGSLGYLIDENNDGTYDMFYSNSTGNKTQASLQGNGDYLIDTNSDGTWDVVYTPSEGSIQVYHEDPMIEYVLIIIVLVVLIIIFYFFSKRMRGTKKQDDQDKTTITDDQKKQ
jgi:hypothetical protein